VQRSTSRSLLSLGAVGAALLLIVGCPASPEPAPSLSQSQATDGPAGDGAAPAGETKDPAGETKAPADAQGTAVLTYADKTYSATLQLCSLYDSGDALFHGIAYDSDGNEVGYLEGDFVGLTDVPNGEARIDFGAKATLQSTDEFVAMGSPGGAIALGDFTATELILAAGAWQSDGAQLPPATLRVTCP
jgi:hypothetical protein